MHTGRRKFKRVLTLSARHCQITCRRRMPDDVIQVTSDLELKRSRFHLSLTTMTNYPVNVCYDLYTALPTLNLIHYRSRESLPTPLKPNSMTSSRMVNFPLSVTVSLNPSYQVLRKARPSIILSTAVLHLTDAFQDQFHR